MPIYEYKCNKCGDVYEIIQGFSDEPQKTHEGCGGDVHRLISAPALQFKGSGWYITDYARGSGKSEAPSGDNGGKSDGKREGKREGKPDSSKGDTKTSESKPAATSGASDKK